MLLIESSIKYFRCKKIDKVFTSNNYKSHVSTQIEIPNKNPVKFRK